MYGAVFNLHTKGHDRMHINREHGFAAVIDGAGGAELSQAAAQALPALIEQNQGTQNSAPEEALGHIVHSLDALPEGHYRKATLAAALAVQTVGGWQVAYANAGDSSVYLMNHSQGNRLQRIAHSPTEYHTQSGRSYIATHEFLGNNRSYQETARLVGSVILPIEDEWTVIGMSDGIQDDDGRGVSTPILEEIVKTCPPARVTREVISTIDPYDDASMFVIARRNQ